MPWDRRWHRGGILIFLATQFILALVLLAINGEYWRKYGGIVHSEVIQPSLPSETAFTENVKQVTTPLNMYIFGNSSAVLAIVAIETIAYFSNSLHPVFPLVINIPICLAWGGCLAVFFLWGGGLEYTGSKWIAQYHSFCDLHDPRVASSVKYIYNVTCGGEKILLIMLPFICLNIIICPLFALFALITAVAGRTHRRSSPSSAGQHKPAASFAPNALPIHATAQPPGQVAQASSPISTSIWPQVSPQPFVHQGVLYQPIGIAQLVDSDPRIELNSHPAPMREMPGDGVK